MIPVLLDRTKSLESLVADKNNGLGKLTETIDCVVVEERNGIYDLTLRIPITAKHYSKIENGSIIRATGSWSSGNQLFRVYKITKPINGVVTIEAHHITYDLAKVAVKPFTANGASAAASSLKSNSLGTYPFTMTSNSNSTAKYTLSEPMSFRGALGGWRGSYLDVYNGEFEWDNLTVKHLTSRGYDNGVKIRYGKNLVDLNQEEDIDGTYTAVLGFATIDESTVLSDVRTAVASTYPRVKIVDFSEDYETLPTKAQLNTKVDSYISNNNITKTNINLEVSFVALWQTEEYKDIAPLERVNLCDTVTILYEELGVDAKAKVIRTEWDVINERYLSIELGEARSNLGETISDNITEKVEKQTGTWIDEAVKNATDLITGGQGGYVVIARNADGEPEEILVMDTPDKTTAVNVIRFNKNGIGFSTTGYNGPFTSAWTIDGSFVADFITAGTLRSINIEGVNIKGSNLRFGSGPYVDVATNSANTGVLFSGTGTVDFETQGQYTLKNIVQGGTNVSNGITLNNTSTTANLILENYWENKLANRVRLDASATTRTLNILNYKSDGTNTANNLYFASGANSNFTSLYNHKFARNESANLIQIAAYETYNATFIWNYNLNNTNNANFVRLTAYENSNNMQLINYSLNNNEKNLFKLDTSTGITIGNNYGTTTTRANELTFNDSTNIVSLKNNKANSSANANNMTLTADTNNTFSIVNYNTSNTNIKNSIVLSTNNGIEITNNVGA